MTRRLRTCGRRTLPAPVSFLGGRYARRRRARSAPARIARSPERLEPRLTLDSTVVFNEIMYHPVDPDTPEWIELYNQMAVDMDLSGWSLTDAVEFEFAEGTVIPGGGYLVVASDPHSMTVPGALGPFAGQLSNGGERLALLDNNGRVMNEVEYGDDGDWPSGPDGSGATLAKRDFDLASHSAANWTTSDLIGGTPASPNFPRTESVEIQSTLLDIGATWRYDDSGTDQGSAWREAAYDDSAWPVGDALFFDEDDALPAPRNTPLTPGRSTYYFRTTFEFEGDPATANLLLDPVIDDGAVFYLNGQELHRQNLPGGPIGFDTPASSIVGNADFSGPISVSAAGALVQGTNVLAVEVHQAPAGLGYGATVLASEPVGYWRLNDGAVPSTVAVDAADAAGPPQRGAQHGAYVDFAVGDLDAPGPRSTDSVTGRLLLGFEADNVSPDFQGQSGGGNDVVLIPDDGSLSFAAGGAFSVEAWVKAAPTQEPGAAVVAKGSGGGGEQYAIDFLNNRYRFFARNAAGQATVVQTNVVATDTWQHVVAVLDAGQGRMELYVDGLLAGGAAAPSTLLGNGHEVSIGARKNANSQNYDLNLDGQVDEVAIYDRALPSAEIRAHFDAALEAPGEPGMEDVVFGTRVLESRTLSGVTLVREETLGIESEWRYDDSGNDLSESWRDYDYDDSAWETGGGLLFLDEDDLPANKQTPLAPGATTYYFRTRFDVDGDLERFTELSLRTYVDDGAVFYLNGQEVHRMNMPEGPISHETFASAHVGNAVLSEPVVLPVAGLLAGSNVLAVEVHQAPPTIDPDPGGAGTLPDVDAALLLHLKADAANVTRSAADRAARWDDLSPAGNDFSQGGDGLQPLWVDSALGGRPVLRFDGTDRLDLVGTGLNRADATDFTFLAVVAGTNDPFALFDSAPQMQNTFRFGAFGAPFPSPNNAVELWDRSPAIPLTVSPAGSVVTVIADRDASNRRVMSVSETSAATNFSMTATGNTAPVLFANPDIGTINTGIHGYFQGDVAEILIFDGALSESDRTAVERYLLAEYSITAEEDLVFGAELLLEEIVVPPTPESIRINEVASTGEGPFWVELTNHGTMPIDLDGFVLTRDGETIRGDYVLDSQVIAPGEYLVLDENQLGYAAAEGDRLFLYPPSEDRLLDAVTARQELRGRSPDGEGPWRVPSEATPGDANLFQLQDRIVINEILYHGRPILADGDQPYRESPQEWIELYNRGTTEVDLSGWRLADAIDFEFAPGTTIGADQYLVIASDARSLAEDYPDIAIAGEFSRSLSDKDDRILLLDSAGNPADEVHYYDGGRWPANADGSGASLELRDPDSDNSRGDAWSASDEASRSPWRTYTYRGIAGSDLPEVTAPWREFAFGLLDGAGEILIDDIRVIESPQGAAVERIQNGSFDSGDTAHWRLLGNHQRGGVIVDPDDPGNYVLHVVASGPTEYQGNQVETTLAGGASVVVGREYEISFRAKWLAGSRQVNSRLYFNRLARTTVLEVPGEQGTPGRRNSRWAENSGPDYERLVHTPAVPGAGQSVTVSTSATDPDGIASLTLHYAVNDGTWQAVAMSVSGDGRYSAAIPGQQAAATVQYYVEGTDTAGATSLFPRGGEDSRALLKVDDGQASDGPAHNFRIIMTPADTELLHRSSNTTSNERLGATVIYNEHEIFHDVGVRLKGSFVGRDVARVGFNLLFNPDQLFRGVHEKVAVDRSQTATAISPTEVLLKHVANHAGDIPSMYDDIIHVIAPRPAQTSVAHLRMAGFDDVYFDSQFDNGSDGNVYEFEVIRWATSTVDGNPESVKNSAQSGNGYANVDIRDLGDDKESYRWLYLRVNNRTRDDYDNVIRLAKAFSLGGAALDAATREAMDVDQWMRAFALQSLGGVGDAYTRGAHHNIRLYERPSDGRILALPWDWDNVFNSPTATLIGGANLAKIINLPANRRLFYGHLRDIIDTTFNTEYMSRWTTHYGEIAGRDYGWVLSYIGQRAAYVNSQLATLAPQVAFEIRSNNGDDFSVDQRAVTLVGDGWIDVREMRLAGDDQPLDVTWDDQDSWRLTLPLEFGANAIDLEAYDHQGSLVGSDRIVVTSTMTDPPDPELSDPQRFLRLTELNYNPHPPTDDELAVEPWLDNDDFEFVELWNTNDQPLDVGGARFTEGIDFRFDDDVVLQADERVLLVRDRTAFELRYGAARNIAGEYVDSGLDNGGETLELVDRLGGVIHRFTYDDEAGWPTRPDGGGSTLEVIDTAGDYDEPRNWRASAERGGTPGEDAVLVSGDVVVNEVLSHTDPPLIDTLELHNTTDEPIDVSGWFLSDSVDDLMKFEIPAGTIIAAEGYLVFDESDFNPTGGASPADFAFSGARGDDVLLVEPPREGRSFRFVNHAIFGAQANGESWGRWPNATGLLFPQRTPTLGGSNSGPRVGPVVISEIMYAPDDPDGPGGVDPGDLEYVEIHNPTDEVVDLTGWTIAGGVDFDFPAGTMLNPLQSVVVVSFDVNASANAAATFRDHYAEPGAVLVGGFSGRLNNAGETIRLHRPDEPPLDDPGFVPLLLEDQVTYDDAPPWPVDASTGNSSLHRVDATLWGEDANSWSSGPPSPGRVDVMPPRVLQVTLNAGLVDPPDLDGRAQPSSWRTQRSEIRTVEVEFSQPVIVAAADLRLTNLGVLAPTDPDVEIKLDDGRLVVTDSKLTIRFDPGELTDGVYRLEILPSVTNHASVALDGDADGTAGDAFVYVGDDQNGFYKLTADWNGDGGVSIFDFTTFTYWFGRSSTVAPEYVNLNGDDGISIFDFSLFAASFGRGVTYPPPLADGAAALGFLPAPEAKEAGPVRSRPRVERFAETLDQGLWETSGVPVAESIAGARPQSKQPTFRSERFTDSLEEILDEIGGDVWRVTNRR